MKDFRVPPEVATAACERWPEAGARWATCVEAEFPALCERYSAAPVSVVGGRYSVVVFTDGERGDLAFRATADPSGNYQARVAQLLAGVGAGPTILDVVVTDTGTWTIMERVVPGTSLRYAPQGTVELEDIASAFRAIAGSDANCDELPRLSDWLRLRLADDVLTDRVPGTSVAPNGERSHALSILQDLGEPRGLCHGDAHPGNLLVSAGYPRVLLIDPRGMGGEVAYDAGVFAMKAAMYDLGVAHVLGRQIANHAKVDFDRMVAWMTVALAARV